MLNKTNQEISFINGYMRRINNQMKRKFLGLESEVFKYETFSNILYGKRNI